MGDGLSCADTLSSDGGNDDVSRVRLICIIALAYIVKDCVVV